MQTNWLAATPPRQISEADSSVRFQQTAVLINRVLYRSPDLSQTVFCRSSIVTGASRVRLCFYTSDVWSKT